MTNEQFFARREVLLFQKAVAEKAHCRLVAAARQRAIDKLTKEYEANGSKEI